MQSLWVFGFIRLVDEVRAELVQDISGSARFFCYSRKKKLFFWLARGPPGVRTESLV